MVERSILILQKIKIIYHIIMKNLAKLPYKVQFDPEYEQYNQRLARLPVPTEPVFQVSDELLKLVENTRERIRDEDLEFFTQNIYSQYATLNQLKEGKKNALDNCPCCGEEAKKQVQCEFCAVMYCKNCCWRKRVLPHLSEPKQSHLECEVCHAKFVKLFANQKFYQQSTVIQKIIDNSNTKLKKLQKQMKTKKQRVDAVDKKKKECKIKEGIILRELKNQEKKVQELQQKLQEVVQQKAEKLRKQQEEAENQKKLQEMEESEKRKQEEELQEAIRRQKEIEAEKEAMKKKQEEMERQLKEQMERAELQQQKQKEREELRKKQEEKKAEEAKKNEVSRLKRMESEERHRKETDQLRNLAKQIVKQPDHLDEKQKVQGPPIVIALSSTPSKPEKEVEHITVTTSPKVEQNLVQSPNVNVNSSFQQDSSPLKVLTSFNLFPGVAPQTTKQVKDMPDRKSGNQKQKGERERTEGTETTQRQVSNHETLQEADKKQETDQEKFEALPQIAINVSQMTVNQLLGIHINPNANQASSRRMSQRESYLKASEMKKAMEQTPIEPELEVKQITAEQKYEILRSSNMSSSLLHSNHQEEELHEHPDPSGSKCNCNIM